MSKLTSQNCICLWSGKTKEMVVVPHEQEGDYKHLSCSDLCCCSDYVGASFDKRQLMLARFAFYLVHSYQIPPDVVHNQLMKLYDYRKGLHFQLYDEAGMRELYDEE